MLSDSQFWQYVEADKELAQIDKQYQEERSDAIEGISPTMTAFHYDEGKVCSASVRVDDYAIYLADLHAQYQNNREKVFKRLEVLEEAITFLYDDEREQYFAWRKSNEYSFPKVLKALRECVWFVLEREKEEVEHEVTVSEWDAAIEAMGEEELFQDYYDPGDSFDKEILKRRALLRQRGRKSDAELSEVC